MKTEKISVQKICMIAFAICINLSGQYWNCICGCCSGTLLWNAS